MEIGATGHAYASQGHPNHPVRPLGRHPIQPGRPLEGLALIVQRKHRSPKSLGLLQETRAREGLRAQNRRQAALEQVLQGAQACDTRIDPQLEVRESLLKSKDASALSPLPPNGVQIGNVETGERSQPEEGSNQGIGPSVGAKGRRQGPIAGSVPCTGSHGTAI